MDFTLRENVSGLISSAINYILILDNKRDRLFWEETYYIAALSSDHRGYWQIEINNNMYNI